MNKKLLNNQENEAAYEQDNGDPTVMVTAVSMVQGIGPNQKSQHDHEYLKAQVMNDIQTK